MQSTNPTASDVSRRDFIKTTAAVGAAAAVAACAKMPTAYAAGNATIKVGLVGCGGRGRGAAADALSSSDGVELTAIADLFPDRIKETQEWAEKADAKIKPKIAKQLQAFTGFDAYQKLLATDVNYVILASPPAFRPMMIEAAAKAGKHIFAEKPVAVCPAGCRQILSVEPILTQKNLGFVGGTQRRHKKSYVETFKRLAEGAIGDILYAEGLWLGGELWTKPRQDGWTDMEYVLRNWTYYTWLAGDCLVEQAMHQVDVMNWAMGGTPKSAIGIGGRMKRTEPIYGNIYDQFAVLYEYPNGQKATVMSRQIDLTYNRTGELIVGTKGRAIPDAGRIMDPAGKTTWRYEGPEDEVDNPYENEHANLIKSIRAGKPINEIKRMTESTLSAIIGRMAAYTGQIVSYKWALEKSKLDLTPKPEMLDLKTAPPPTVVAIPSKEKLI